MNKESAQEAVKGFSSNKDDGSGVPEYAFLTMTVGSVVDICGVQCVLEHINQGKRRLTFRPIDRAQHMPVTEMKNPITKVHRNGK